MAKAEQQIDIGGPRSDAVMRGQCGMSVIGFERGERIEIERAADRALLISFSVLIFGAERPTSRQPFGVAPCGSPTASNGSNAAARRPQIALGAGG